MGDEGVERQGRVHDAWGGVRHGGERKRRQRSCESGRLAGSSARGGGDGRQGRRVAGGAPRMRVIEMRNTLRLQSPAPGGWNLQAGGCTGREQAPRRRSGCARRERALVYRGVEGARTGARSPFEGERDDRDGPGERRDRARQERSEPAVVLLVDPAVAPLRTGRQWAEASPARASAAASGAQSSAQAGAGTRRGRGVRTA